MTRAAISIRRASAVLPLLAALGLAMGGPALASGRRAGPIAYEATPTLGLISPTTGRSREAASLGSNPSLFPGSRRMAYIRVVGFEDPGPTEYSIYVKSLHPYHPHAPGRRVTGQRAFFVRDLAVTPDGRRIVFAASRGVGSSSGGAAMEVWSISVGGGDLRRLTRNDRWDTDVDVSPDGRRVAYAEEVDGRAQIFAMAIDGSHRRRVTFDDRRDRAPHWSPDGRRLVYFSVPGHKARGYRDEDVFSISAAGGPPRHLIGYGEDPLYSPDGRQIAFLRGYAIWLMRPDGTGARRLGTETGETEITAIDWGTRVP